MRKDAIRTGVELLYMDAIGNFKDLAGLPDQDALDAIAVGHCYLVEQLNRRIDASR